MLALITTHPLWLHLAEAVPVDIGDPLLNTWVLAWDAHALLTDPLHLFDANIYYPLPNTLAYSEHLISTALLIMPLALASGEPVLAYNVSLLLSFPLAGLGMYLLVLRWTGRRAAALLAGLAFAFAPYRLAAIAHLQLLTIQWLPFSVLALERVLKYQISNGKYQISNQQTPAAPQVRVSKSQLNGWVLFILLTTLQVLASWYLAVFTGLVLGVYALSWPAARARYASAGPTKDEELALRPPKEGVPKGRPMADDLRRPSSFVGRRSSVLRPLARLAAGLTIVAGLALPFAIPYLDVLPALREARPISLALSLAAHPSDLLTAAPYLRVSGPPTQALAARPGFTEENTLFLGLVAPLLAVAGLALGRPRWRVLALAGLLVVSLALTFAGPYRVLTGLLPALTVVRVPARWIIPATFALAALAGHGAARLDEGRRTKDQGRRACPELVEGTKDDDQGANGRHSSPVTRHPSLVLRPSSFVVFLLALLLILESFSAPLPLAWVGARADLPPVYQVLWQAASSAPDDWAVVELPMHVAPAPEYPETKRMLASTLGWWGLVNGYSGLTPERQSGLGQALDSFPSAAAVSALQELGKAGVRYLVVHPGEAPLQRAVWESTGRWQVERATSLLPAGSYGPDDLYLINPYGDDLITHPAAVSDAFWSAHAPAPVDVRFSTPASEGEIRLLAYLVYEEGRLEGWKVGSGFQPSSLPAFQPSSLPTRLTLYWQTSAPLDADYTVFVHSLNAAGELVGQADAPPVGNHYPTGAWRSGEIVQDSRRVPPGDRYLVGLYEPVSGQRLPAFSADGQRLPDDAVLLVAGRP